MLVCVLLSCYVHITSVTSVDTILIHIFIQARASSIPDVLFLGAADILQCLLWHKASLRPTVPHGRNLSATIHPTVSVGLPE